MCMCVCVVRAGDTFCNCYLKNRYLGETTQCSAFDDVKEKKRELE